MLPFRYFPVAPPDLAGGFFDEPRRGGSVGRCALHVEFGDADGACVVELAGDLDIATADALRSALGVAVRTARSTPPEAPVVVVELAGVLFCGARGLHILLDAADAAAGVGARLVLAHRPRSVQRLLEILDVARRPHPLPDDPTAVEVTPSRADDLARPPSPRPALP